MRPWYRRLLAWLRIEDEHGVLSLTTVGFVAGVVCLLSGKQVSLTELAAFTVGLGAYHAKKRQQHQQTVAAMEGAHEHAIAQQQQAHAVALAEKTADAKTLRERVEALAEQVKLLATPEQMQKLRDVLGRRA